MPEFKLYLAYDNAKEAMEYYKTGWGAIITDHVPLNDEVVK